MVLLCASLAYLATMVICFVREVVLDDSIF